MTRVILMLVFVLFLPARLLRTLTGRDPLRLRKPQGATSYWINRRPVTDTASYFSEESASEGPSPRGAGFLTSLLLSLAKFHAPRRQSGADAARSSRDREQGIPDEIYTLW